MSHAIVCIAPFQELGDLFAEVCRELHKDIPVEIGDLGEGARQALAFEEQGIDVIISRGGTTIAIKETVVDVPVVDIHVSGFDIIRALYLARQETERIAVVGFEPFTYEPDDLGKMLGLQLSVVPLKKEWYTQHDHIEENLQNLQQQGFCYVVGDHISVKIARQLGMTGFLIRSGKEALLQAILEAERVAAVRRQEIEKAKRARTIIDFAYEGILSVDRNGIIDIFNPQAEKILGRKAYKMIGRPLSEALPTLDLSQTLRTGHQEREKIVSIDNEDIMANIIPITVAHEVVRIVATFQHVSQIQRAEQRIRNELYLKGHTADNTFDDIVGSSPALEQVKEQARNYAQIDLPILMYGETGTGKELFAQAIHNAGARHRKPFVAFNCAALPESLLESELFGYVEGAFTGARKKGRSGLFEQAHGGTLFLDEIGEVPQSIQTRLLRVLQERKIRRLGDDRVTPVDVRIIAATNKRLAQSVDEKTFREDLYYRINVLNITLPPLRERREDISLLIDFFLKKGSQRLNKLIEGVSHNGINVLMQYDWPGNVRQLENVVERLIVSSRKRYIMTGLVNEIMQSLRGYAMHGEQPSSAEPHTIPTNELRIPLDAGLADIESLVIQQVLQAEHGNKGAAAKRLRISRTTLWRKLKTSRNNFQ